MIPAVHPRGTNVGRLLRYLFGPGKREEHVNPRLVAAWDGAGLLARLEPPTRADGRRDMRRLTELLEQPVASGWNAPRQTVWHCSIRNHPTDRTLTDGQWGYIAAEMMAAVGLAPHGDPAAVRWVAVRHAADHVHLVATLVRQDRRTAWAWQDKRKAQQACRDLEDRYGLYRVAPPGSSSRCWPGPSELNKAARLNSKAATRWAAASGPVVAPRELLRQRVRSVAAVAVDEADFFARLTHVGVLVRLRHSTRNSGMVTGYAVGTEWHTTAAGDTVWYGGGRLAPDLTLPRLRDRWDGCQPAQPSGGSAARLAAMGGAFPSSGMYQRAADITARAAAAICAAASPRQASAIAGAAADLLTAMAQVWEGRAGGPLTDAAEVFDRATHEPHRRPPADRPSQARQLRAMARLISVMGALSCDGDATAALQLIYTLAALAENLADLRETQQRRYQSQAARTAARQLRSFTPPPSTAPTSVRAPAAASSHQPTPGGRPWTDRRSRLR